MEKTTDIKKENIITFRAKLYHKGENSIAFFIQGVEAKKAWNNVQWFTLSQVKTTEVFKDDYSTICHVEAPEQLLMKKGIINQIKKV